MSLKPAGRQAFAWYYLRVTGLLMVALVLIHLLVMHYTSVPSATTTTFVDGRWSGAGWRAFDWTLLLLALTHGAVGVQGMLREVVRRPAIRAALDVAAAAVTVAALALGTATVIAASPFHRTGAPSGYTWLPSALTAGLVAVGTATYLAVGAVAAAFGLRLVRGEPIGRWNYAGQWAFALNRAAGAGILAFLLVHVLDVALVPLAPDLY